MPYYIGLGSNMGDRESHLADARRRIKSEMGSISGLSSIYETEPYGPVSQRWFLNQAVELSSSMDPPAVLASAKRIEREMGRMPGPRFGPRIIDIDILLAGETIWRSPELTIPHPGLAERNFVLLPLMDIAGNVRDPVSGKTIAELSRECSDKLEVRAYSLYR